jgi:hypothetical protein
VLAPDYDAFDSPPATESAACSFHGAADDAPWKQITINFDPKRFKELFVRTGAPGSTTGFQQDIKTYDVAVLFVCTVDAVTAAKWGKVLLEYEVELINPQVSTVANYMGCVVRSSTSPTPSNPIGLIPWWSPGSILDSYVNNSLYFTNLVIGQTYMVTMWADGSTVTGVQLNADAGFIVNSVPVNNQTNAGSTRSMDVQRLIATDIQGTLSFTASAASVTGFVVIVAPTATDAGL